MSPFHTVKPSWKCGASGSKVHYFACETALNLVQQATEYLFCISWVLPVQTCDLDGTVKCTVGCFLLIQGIIFPRRFVGEPWLFCFQKYFVRRHQQYWMVWKCWWIFCTVQKQTKNRSWCYISVNMGVLRIPCIKNGDLVNAAQFSKEGDCCKVK